jgi:hypothetical protein
MAATLQAAFEGIDDHLLDRATELPAGGIADLSRATIVRIVRMLAVRHRWAAFADIEDAVQDAALEILEKDYASDQDADGAAGVLYVRGRYAVLNIGARRRREKVLSVDGLFAETGDSAFHAARKVIPQRPVVAPSRSCPGRKWSRESILGAMQEFEAIQRRQPTAKDCENTASLPAAKTIVEHFGTFNAAVSAAGMTPTVRRKRWTREEVVEAVAGFARREGAPPSCVDLSPAAGMPGKTTFARHFGGSEARHVQAALQEARRSEAEQLRPLTP